MSAPHPLHSGSRWEPLPTGQDGPVTEPVGAVARSRATRRHRPVVAVLVSLLTLGGAGGAVYAYTSSGAEQTPVTGGPRVGTQPRPDQGTAPEVRRVARHHHHDDDGDGRDGDDDQRDGGTDR